MLIETDGQVLDDHVLHAKAALELGDQLVVRGANLLVDVDALAMLGDAIGELARAPVLGLFNLAALFGAGVLDAGEDFLDFVFRRGRANDEDQIVQTLFHVMTSFLLFPGAWPVKIVATPCGAGRAKARPYRSASPATGLPRLDFFFAAASPCATLLSQGSPASSIISAATSSSALRIGR